MTETDVDNPKPWYRQFWPWFLISLPASAVVAGITTVVIATLNRDSLVVGDYYKQGLAINERLDSQQAAHDMGLTAAMLLRDNRYIRIEVLEGTSIDDETLILKMIHTTLAERDRIVSVRRLSRGVYVTILDDELVNGHWQFILHPTDKAWRLESRVQLPRTSWSLEPNI